MGWLFCCCKNGGPREDRRMQHLKYSLGVPPATGGPHSYNRTQHNAGRDGLGAENIADDPLVKMSCQIITPNGCCLLNLLFDLHILLTTASFESRADWESILIAAIASVVPQWCVQKNELLANRTCFAADLTRRWCFSSRYKWFHSSEIHRWHLLGRRYGIEMD